MSDMPITEISHYRARYYNPSIGRFISEDPIGLKSGPNFYKYVRNNPLSLRDPLGEDWKNWIPDSWVPKYGNWGGPDWSGGWHPSQHGGQDGPSGPIDSMDRTFMNHDHDYERDMCNSSTPNSNCDKISDPIKQAVCRAKAADDNKLHRNLLDLGDDPTKWPEPAPDPDAARRYRQGVLDHFPWPK